MPITNPQQYLAEELIKELEDRQPNIFGMYCAFIKKFGEQKIRTILSEVLDGFRKGKISRGEKVKLFMWRISQEKYEKRNTPQKRINPTPLALWKR